MLLYLNLDSLFQIMNKLNIEDVHKICKISKYFADQICQNNEFWKRRYFQLNNKKYYQLIDENKIINWKEQYKKSIGNVYIFRNGKESQLGIKNIMTNNNFDNIVKLPLKIKIKKISLGNNHSLL